MTSAAAEGGSGVSRVYPLRFQPARLELPLLDPQVAREDGLGDRVVARQRLRRDSDFEHRDQVTPTCATHDLCGSGLVEGYGHAATTLDITGAVFDPATGCLTNVTALRNVELVDDPSSTLALALTDGLICRVKGSATFTISAATGVFTGLVVLPGTVRVTLIPGTPEDTAQYRATIAP
jgi:hypothetical protein